MADHLHISRQFHDAGFEKAIRATYLGQAHIAGTGPEGKTCRECQFYFLRVARDDEYVETHQRYAKSNAAMGGQLKRHNCNYVIANKAKRRIPHDARACRFFEQSENPPAVEKPQT